MKKFYVEKNIIYIALCNVLYALVFIIVFIIVLVQYRKIIFYRLLCEKDKEKKSVGQCLKQIKMGKKSQR